MGSAREAQIGTGITVAAVALFLSNLGSTLVFPFALSHRDSLGCDALCAGSMQSTKSALAMGGQLFVGRLSDIFGRKVMLGVGALSLLVSHILALNGRTVIAMWMAMVPPALLHHNFSITKALFADYCAEMNCSESQRASVLGKVGMIAGVSFMLGPLLAASFFESYAETLIVAVSLVAISGSLLTRVPVVGQQSRPTAASWCSLVDFSSIRKPGIRLLLFIRLFMGLAYHVFTTVWMVSLRARFAFGAKEHAHLMSWIGLWFALSQGFITKVVLGWSRADAKRLLLICWTVLGGGRLVAMWAQEQFVVYVVMALVLIALGIANTLLASACAKLAPKDQVGGTFGLLEAMEGLAGLCGPALGGVLNRIHPELPIACVLGAYAAIFIMTVLYYHEHVMDDPVRNCLAVD